MIARSSRNTRSWDSESEARTKCPRLAAGAKPHVAARATLFQSGGGESPQQHVPGYALLFLDPAACKLRAGRGGCMNSRKREAHSTSKREHPARNLGENLRPGTNRILRRSSSNRAGRLVPNRPTHLAGEAESTGQKAHRSPRLRASSVK